MRAPNLKKASTELRNAVLPGDPTVDYPYALPYGLKPEAGVLVRDPETAPVVSRIFARAGEGADAETIAKELNAERIASPVEKQAWTAQLVEQILRNPAYIGEWGGFGKLDAVLVEPAVFESAQASVAS
jgi:hypothetical protein